MDLNAFGQEGQNPIRKISMTCLLSDPSEFTGGDLLFQEMGDQKPLLLKQGQAIFLYLVLVSRAVVFDLSLIHI